MKSFLCISVIAVFLVAPSTASTSDCIHSQCTTVCKYPNPKPAPACGRVVTTGLTTAEKNEIVSKHNSLRQFVAAGRERRGNPGPQPAATNMKTLTWDNEIAEAAQRWANQCHWGHDDCRDVDRFCVGQNIAQSPYLNTQLSDLIQMWYNEVINMNQNNVYKYKFDTSYGHYSQIVWANTEKVGCGKITYRVDGRNKYYLVCNYGPAGNFRDQPIYATKV